MNGNQSSANKIVKNILSDWQARFEAVGGLVFSDGSLGFECCENSEENQALARRMIHEATGNQARGTIH